MNEAERHQRIKALFLEVLDAAPDDREAMITRGAEGDEGVAQEVRSLLAHHVADDDLIAAREAPTRPDTTGPRPSAPESDDPLGLVGQLLDDRYQVERLCAEGGFGLVYRAEQIRWRRPVAIKVFRLDDQQDQAIREAFIKEGAILAELSRKTTTIVQSYDIGSWQGPQGKPHLYTALEWLDGETLSARMRWADGQPWPLEQIIDTLDEAVAGLAVAHDNGVAHRDVKPGNIFLLDGGGAKLLDFGIAKLAAEHEQGFKGTGGTLRAFTVSYGAPEQLTRELGATGPWTDVYALALICTELLLGRRVGIDDDPRQTLAVLNHPDRRPTPRALGGTVSDAVETVLARALAYRPQDRFDDAAAFWSALKAASTTPDRPTRWWLPAAALLAGLALLGAGVYVAMT